MPILKFGKAIKLDDIGITALTESLKWAMTVDTVRISEARRLRTETCASADCESKLPMTIRYFPGGPSEPIVQIMRASDICIHCATKMYIWGIELGAALK